MADERIPTRNPHFIKEYVDILYSYGYCDGDAAAARREYLRRFPDRRTPDNTVFIGMYKQVRETGLVQRPYDFGRSRQTTETAEAGIHFRRAVEREGNITSSHTLRQRSTLPPFYEFLISIKEPGEELATREVPEETYVDPEDSDNSSDSDFTYKYHLSDDYIEVPFQHVASTHKALKQLGFVCSLMTHVFPTLTPGDSQARAVRCVDPPPNPLAHLPAHALRFAIILSTMCVYRNCNDFFGKPSTDIKGPTTDPTLDVPSSSRVPLTDDSAVSLSENTLTDVASISKEQAEDVPPVPGVAGVSDDPAKWTIDEFTRDHICKNGANQNIKNDFPKNDGWLSEDSLEDHDSEDEHHNTDKIVRVLQDKIDNDADDGHFLKQYLPNTPHKWGFKLYLLCDLMGYAHKFKIYSGQGNSDKLPDEPDLGATGNVESVETDITIVIELYEALIHFVGETRENFDEFEKKKAKKLSFVQEYQKNFRRNRKRKLLPGETNIEELKRRRDAYKLLNNKFYFTTNLTNLSISEVEDKAKALQMIYSTDLEDNFTKECLHFRSHCSIKNEERKSAVSLLKWLRTEGLQTIYPNVDIGVLFKNNKQESNGDADHISAQSKTDSEVDADIPSSDSDSDDLPLLELQQAVIKDAEDIELADHVDVDANNSQKSLENNLILQEELEMRLQDNEDYTKQTKNTKERNFEKILKTEMAAFETDGGKVFDFVAQLFNYQANKCKDRKSLFGCWLHM
ncbi:hypothetical protein EVAR_53334_1 [Eumeta japonica]|uniref:DUF4817 domain-containing protein n=1 Tax=Eumeta variegata TaxID=151549 RepID=A0A4C1X805_EUMVA|nr:hypothetical protein EVAR_53334_1 [Eumeta japonica]